MGRALPLSLFLAAACGGEALPDAPPEPPAAELQLRYPLDGDARSADGLGPDGVATDVEPAEDRAGAGGAALRFGSTGSVVSMSGVDIGPPFSVQVWVRRDAPGAGDPACLEGAVDGVVFAGYRFLLAFAPDGRVVYAVEDAEGGLSMPLSAPWSPGWHALTLVDTGAEGELWIDGEPVAAGPVPSEPRNASFMTLGGHPAFPCGLRGELDDARIFRGQLRAP